MELVEARLRAFAERWAAETKTTSAQQRKRLAQFTADLIQAYKLELPLSVRDVLVGGGDVRTLLLRPSDLHYGSDKRGSPQSGVRARLPVSLVHVIDENGCNRQVSLPRAGTAGMSRRQARHPPSAAGYSPGRLTCQPG